MTSLQKEGSVQLGGPPHRSAAMCVVDCTWANLFAHVIRYPHVYCRGIAPLSSSMRASLL